MKKLLTICSIWILFTAKVDSFSIPFLSNAQSIISLVTDLSDLAMGRHDVTAGNLFKKKTDASLIKVTQLSAQIGELTQSFNVKMDKLMVAVLKDTPRAIQLRNLIRRLIDYNSRIDELYEDYLFYVSENGDVTRFTIEEFGKVVTSHKFGDVPDILRQIYFLFFPGQLGREEDSLLEVMTASLEDGAEHKICNRLKTNQQHLYELYETIIITEIKGFTMSSYAYGMLSIYRNSSFDAEIRRAMSQTMKRCMDYLTAVRNAFLSLRHEIYMCDPPKHIKGETFVELNSLTRVVVLENMVLTVCADTGCPSINRDNFLEISNWNPLQPCNGLMYDCENLGTYTSICELPPEYDRRYDWVESDNMYGSKTYCSNGTRKELNSFFSWSSMDTCIPCFCKCSEQKPKSKAIRTISLRPQLADIDNNMVVTGVRFEQKDMMIHVQIEEGKLLPAGQIDMSSVHWVKLEDFRYSYDDGNFFKVDLGNETRLKNGTDYQFIHKDQREVYLDNVYSRKPYYVVTGLKMSQDPENSKAIQLDVHITPVNGSTGLLVPTDDKPSKWITHKDMPGHHRSFTKRKYYDVTELERGDDYYDNRPNFMDFSKILFAISNKYSDASQSTVPILDRRSVAPSVRLPLTGVSLLYRGRRNSSGFLGFRVRTINFYNYLNSAMQPETKKEYLTSFYKTMENTMPQVDK